jgi:hypothetical protein
VQDRPDHDKQPHRTVTFDDPGLKWCPAELVGVADPVFPMGIPVAVGDRRKSSAGGREGEDGEGRRGEDGLEEAGWERDMMGIVDITVWILWIYVYYVNIS